MLCLEKKEKKKTTAIFLEREACSKSSWKCPSWSNGCPFSWSTDAEIWPPGWESQLKANKKSKEPYSLIFDLLFFSYNKWDLTWWELLNHVIMNQNWINISKFVLSIWFTSFYLHVWDIVQKFLNSKWTNKKQCPVNRCRVPNRYWAIHHLIILNIL